MKKGYEKRDLCYSCILLGIMILLILYLMKDNLLFGSKIDWISQHSVLPDYFRNQFYETGKFIPQLALQLGAGQNIFNVSYYGFLSPTTLLSYLFPFIPMYYYVAIISVLGVVFSVLLFFYWLRKNNFSKEVAFVSSILFLLSAPLMFHSHRHIMFINYFPFLLMALIGVNEYFRKKKTGLLVAGVFLMIMTSYFYSISGIFVIYIYAINFYIKEVKIITKKDFDIKSFFFNGIKFTKYILISILMTAILLLPTFASLSGRATVSKIKVEYLDLIIPRFDFQLILYSRYSLGLSFILIIAIFVILDSKKKHDIFLGLCSLLIIVFPIFSYFLNGFLYTREKILIPFLPLFVLIIAIAFNKIIEEGYKSKRLMSFLFALGIFLFISKEGIIKLFFAFDIIITFIGMIVYYKKSIKMAIYLPSIIVMSMIFINANEKENYVEKSIIDNIYSDEKLELIEEILEKEKEELVRWDVITNSVYNSNIVYSNKFYRTTIYSSAYNKDYNYLFYDIFNNPNGAYNRVNCISSNNILFNTFMGVKYLVSDQKAPIGYEHVNTAKDDTTYVNEDVFSTGYASTNIINRKEFDRFDHYEKIIGLLSGIVVDDVKTNIDKNEFDIIEKEVLDLGIPRIGNRYVIDSEKDFEVELKTQYSHDEYIYLMNMYFNKTPKNRSISISVNNSTNILASATNPYPNENKNFGYVLSSTDKGDDIKLKFSKGKYSIQALILKRINYEEIKKRTQKIDRLSINECRDDYIKGDINVKKDGYFTFTIPYDKGFSAKVDGKDVKVEKVNTAFIGFPISKGEHVIELFYEAPLFKRGRTITILGVIFYLIDIILRKRRENVYD